MRCLYSYAAVDKISTDIARRAVPVRYNSMQDLGEKTHLPGFLFPQVVQKH